jgi:hypothetical protein
MLQFAQWDTPYQILHRANKVKLVITIHLIISIIPGRKLAQFFSL